MTRCPPAVHHTIAVTDNENFSDPAEDRGDGVFILIPSAVPKVRIRLRIALHAGEVHYDSHGVAGMAITHAFRLVDQPMFKAALADSAGLLGVIVSEWFYDEVVRHYPAAEPDSYCRVPLGLVRQR